MNCPTCNSDATQRLEVIYEQGTNHINTTSNTKVRPFMGVLPTAKATTSTTGVSMSAAARKAAPPFKNAYKTAGIGLVVGFVILIMGVSSQLGSIGILLGLGVAGFSGWLIYRAYTYNTTAWPVAYQAWEKSWMCNKCGSIFRGE